MDYKDTLLMPKTKFKMRGGLVNKEPQMQEEWRESSLYEKKLTQNEGNTTYVLHDGAPSAHGSLQMGHALDKIIGDIILRSKPMRGLYAAYVPEWDTHGRPIEQALTNGGVDRNRMSTEEFR